MSRNIPKTMKGAAAMYVVIFTTTLLGIIALSFARIMVAESQRTINYSLSQSAYNSALAGVEDAKIVLLRYQNCRARNSYSSSSSKNSSEDCNDYLNSFSTSDAAHVTSQKCDTVGMLLHKISAGAMETVIQTNKSNNTDAIDQAYTCVKVSTYTQDFLTVLHDNNATKLIPLRTENQTQHDNLNRIQIQWFSQNNYNSAASNGLNQYATIGSGKLTTNTPGYITASTEHANQFGSKAIVPPPLQVSFVQTSETYMTKDFYVAAQGDDGIMRTNRGTLMLRPSNDTELAASQKVDLTNSDGNHSNVIATSALAGSANKSLNTPIDVYCSPDMSDWGNYACSADITIPEPVGGLHRNMTTTFLVLNLPYTSLETEVSVKMYHCSNKNLPTTSTNCGSPIEFAGVQPIVDSTGRANDLFRRVESRIELYDTNFPISSFALAMTDPNNNKGIAKNFYVTNNCYYSSTEKGANNTIEVKKTTCANASGSNGE